MPSSPTLSLTTSVDADVRAVVELFTGPLAAVAFPGVDGRVLAALAARLDEDAAELARLELAAASVRARVADTRDELCQRASRALAYARVYAETDGPPELAARLDALIVPRPRASTPPAVAPAVRKRGRPRKASSGDSLFEPASAAPAP